MFDFESFCADYNIEYSKKGKNSRPGWIQIKCPFCTDQSNHGGCNIQEGYYNCWICSWHPLDLLIKKLVPKEHPKKIISIYSDFVRIRKEKRKNKTALKIPGKDLQTIHKKYLRKRGLSPNILSEKYSIKGTDNFSPGWKFRIIIPIFQQSELVTYQGRDITGKANVSYKNCPEHQEITSIKKTLYNIDNCKEKWVGVCEGVFDVWNMGDNFCATFGVKYTKEQIYLLSKFDFIYILFDPDLPGQKSAERLSKILSSFNKIVYNIQLKTDPGTMEKEERKRIIIKIKENQNASFNNF